MPHKNASLLKIPNNAFEDDLYFQYKTLFQIRKSTTNDKSLAELVAETWESTRLKY